MRIDDEKAGRLRYGLHKLDRVELQYLGELIGFRHYANMTKSKDDFITEIIEKIDKMEMTY